MRDLMHLFSRPFMKNRRDPNYFSNMGEYMSDVIETLDSLENAGSYWRLKWFEKIRSFARKLGLI